MSDSVGDGEMERTNVHLPVKEKEVVSQRSDMTVAEACRRTGLLPAARGEDAVEAAVRQEDATEQWERTESGIASVLAYLDNIAGDGGAVTIETVHEEFEAFCDERGEAIAEQFADSVSEVVDEYEQEQSAKFESVMADLDSSLQDGNHVFPAHGQVTEAAERGGMPPEEVIDRLKQRNPDVPEAQFSEKSGSASADEVTDLL